VVAVVFKKKGKKDKGDPMDKILIDLWKQENEVRRLEGLPPMSLQEWLRYYSQRHGDGQGGGL
jgi:hypothetical protein